MHRASSLFVATLLLGCSETRIDLQPDAGPKDPCPAGPFGGPMVKVPALDGTSYCIDAREVTNADYEAFLASSPRLEDRPDVCNHPPAQADGPLLKTFVPDGMWPRPSELRRHPVMNVTWCDANTYCKANGKRLCGKIGGGELRDPLLLSSLPPNGAATLDSAQANEWWNVCTAGGRRSRPFEGSATEGTCLPYLNSPNGTTSPVDDERCMGGFQGITGMVENVGELIDLCFLNLAPTEQTLPSCAYQQGGDSANGEPYVCVSYSPLEFYRASPFVGFRCCADVLP